MNSLWLIGDFYFDDNNIRIKRISWFCSNQVCLCWEIKKGTSNDVPFNFFSKFWIMLLRMELQKHSFCFRDLF